MSQSLFRGTLHRVVLPVMLVAITAGSSRADVVIPFISVVSELDSTSAKKVRPVPSKKALQKAPTITVYKSPTCGCCEKWIDHLRSHGFAVVVRDTADVTPVKTRLGIPASLHSCHTATVSGYVVEGHVPASDIQKLLRHRPAIQGIAVPGMPIGSPGMEMKGVSGESYNVIAYSKDGKTRVYSRH